METTTKASFDSCVKNDDEIVVAYCGPVAEIVAQKLVDIFSSSSSRTSSQRRISPLKLGEIIQEEEEEDKEEEDNDNDNAMTTTKTTATPTTPCVVVIVVETVENDEIAKEGLEVVKILLNALKKINKTTKKKSKRRRKYVLVGVGDSRFLAERQYFRSNQNSAEDCNAAARVLDKLLEKSDKWERVGKRLELDYGREFEGKLERWVTSLVAKDDFL
ncbi:unnamed protein product [Bathycoccus prasinos]|jgi:hypothetical protein|tara:strand:- start:1829 stop:2479 length:651 start_codon:yes stop_codon:yes gene_type:complete